MLHIHSTSVSITVVMYTVPLIGVTFTTVFILDNGFHVYVWVGKEATSHEKGSGLTLAHVSIVGNLRLSFLLCSTILHWYSIYS